MRLYTLDAAGQPVPCDDILTWARWFESTADNNSRRVGETTIDTPDGGKVVVSTVFLGLDHNYFHGDAPILFETMVFGGADDRDCVRYSSRRQAEHGHAAMCEKVRATPPPDD